MQQSAGGLKPLTPSDAPGLRLGQFNLLFYWIVFIRDADPAASRRLWCGLIPEVLAR